MVSLAFHTIMRCLRCLAPCHRHILKLWDMVVAYHTIYATAYGDFI